VLVTLVCKIGEVEGMVNICLPYILLEPIMPKLSAHFWFSNAAKEHSPEQFNALKSRLERAYIPVTVLLGRTTIKIAELLALQCGDVLQLDCRATEELPILVGQREKYLGRPGIVGSKLGVQITGICGEGDETEDE
ncbi:MAG: FliM/FliN family flagellar motor switch protein, partial [Heliobacteriaceae bacterium]|nr:FliM/FliN family flagellar motor switch protein [Heliobacteriaceae bacterium]